MAIAQKVERMNLRRFWLVLLWWGAWTDSVEGWRSSLLGHRVGSFRQRSGKVLAMPLACFWQKMGRTESWQGPKTSLHQGMEGLVG